MATLGLVRVGFYPRSLLFVILCQLVFVGCSGSGGRSPVAPVTGRVVYNGEPVAGAVVQFILPNSPRIATGKTDATGSFQLSTYGSNDGAFVGKNGAIVLKTVPGAQTAPESTAGTAATSTLEPEKEQARAQIQNRMKAATTGGNGRTPTARTANSVLPAKYADPQNPQLFFEVEAGKANDFEIILTD